MNETRTLSIDCGGTGLKAAVIGASGLMVSERVRVSVEYPMSPSQFVDRLVELTTPLPSYDRVTVGLPGMIRGGIVMATPHYQTVAGPFSATDPALLTAWTGFDAAAGLGRAYGVPTRVYNDAQLQGASVISGQGVELVLTLGTGLGFSIFENGRVGTELEMSQHPFRKGQTYDEQLGNHARQALGNGKWSKRVMLAVETLRPVVWFDRVYLGGGNARKLQPPESPDVIVVENINGILGGAKVWDDPNPLPTPRT